MSPEAPSSSHHAPAVIPDDDGGSAMAGARTNFIWTLASRILGFVRDLLMAEAFGLSRVADAFYIAWTIPNLFRRLFGEGALSAVFVPTYVQTREEHDDDRAGRLFAGVLGELLVVLVVILLLIEAGVVIAGRVADLAPVLLSLTAVLAPYVIVACSSALLGGLLHAHRSFAPSAAAPVVLNAVWIAALAIVSRTAGATAETTIHVVAAAILGGGVLGFVLHLVPLARRGLMRRPRLTPRNPDVGRVRSLLVPTLFGLAVTQVNLVADRGIAWAFVPDGGAVAALYYAFRLTHLPVALSGLAIAVAALPELATRAARGEDERLGASLGGAIRATVFVSAPAAAGLTAIAGPLVLLLFARGAFDADAAGRTAGALAAYAPSVVFLSLTALLSRALYALGDVRTVARAAAIAVVFNVIFDLLLVFPLRETGLALATTLAQVVNVALLAWALQGKLRPAAREAARSPVTAYLFPLLLSAAMGAGCWALGLLLPDPLGAGLGGRAIAVIVPIAAGVAFYAAAGALLCPEPWQAVIGAARRRAKKRRRESV